MLLMLLLLFCGNMKKSMLNGSVKIQRSCGLQWAEMLQRFYGHIGGTSYIGSHFFLKSKIAPFGTKGDCIICRFRILSQPDFCGV